MADDKRTKRTVNVSDLNTAVKNFFDEDRDKLLEDIKSIIDDRLSLFEEKLEIKVLALEQTISDNHSEINLLKLQVTSLETQNQAKQNDISNLRSELDDLKLKTEELAVNTNDNQSLSENIIENVKSLEARVEERTNRQLRKTLVIKGLKELDSETWEDTRDLVAETIHKNIKSVSFDEAYDMLERVHRGPYNPLKVGRRVIYAALYQWDDCEFIVNKFRKINRLNGQLKLYVDYKYGPLTTCRRNEALKVRREPINEQKIVQGYISYPAKLHVKYDKNGDWVIHDDFSKKSVSGKSLFTSIPS